jgi:hypothetical protein
LWIAAAANRLGLVGLEMLGVKTRDSAILSHVYHNPASLVWLASKLSGGWWLNRGSEKNRMSKLLAILAATAMAAWCQPALAAEQSTPATPDASMTPAPAPAASTGTLGADVAGQAVYDQSGQNIGTIKSVATDASGNQQAIVSVGKFLGLGSRDVQIPASALQAKAGGGFTTSLSADQLKALPAVSGK